MIELRIRIQEANCLRIQRIRIQAHGNTNLDEELQKLTPCRSVQASAEPGQGWRRSHPTHVVNTEH